VLDPTFNPAVTGRPTSTRSRRPNAQAITASQNPFCQQVPRTAAGGLGNIFLSYANTGQVHLRGIDAQLDWGYGHRPGTLTLNTVVNYQMHFETSSLFPQIGTIDYVGTQGTARTA
jgi:hypothetical protein